MKEIARIEINADGDRIGMFFLVDTINEDERIVIGTYLARALLDICADIDPDMLVTTALRFIGAATKLPRAEGVYS